MLNMSNEQAPLKNQKSNNGANLIEGEITLAGAFDVRMVRLLTAIEQTGSITQAAKQVGLSYKGAWQILERVNKFAPKELLTSETGGSKGGGTSLTCAGRALLQLFTRLETQHQEFLRQINNSLGDDSDALLLLESHTIKTSAGNRLSGVIIAVLPEADNAEVIVRLLGGERLSTTLSFAEFDLLELGVGKPVLLLIDAQEIEIATAADGYGSSAGNLLNCSIIRVRHNPEYAEAVIRLVGGERLVATLAPESVKTMGLRPGLSARAIIKASDVLLGAINR